MKLKDLKVGEEYALQPYTGSVSYGQFNCLKAKVLEIGVEYEGKNVDWKTGKYPKKNNGVRVEVVGKTYKELNTFHDLYVMAVEKVPYYDEKYKEWLDKPAVLFLRGPALIAMPWKLYEPKLDEAAKKEAEQRAKSEEIKERHDAAAAEVNKLLKSIGLEKIGVRCNYYRRFDTQGEAFETVRVELWADGDQAELFLEKLKELK